LHPAFAHLFTGAFCPSTINSAADRAIAASNHSNPLSLPINSSRQRPSPATSSSCPSVTRNISLIGATHAFGNSRLASTAEKIARTHSRNRKIFRTTASTTPGSLPSSDSSRIPRSSLTTRESTRKSTNSVHERSCATGLKLAKSSANLPAINFGDSAFARNPAPSNLPQISNQSCLSRRLYSPRRAYCNNSRHYSVSTSGRSLLYCVYQRIALKFSEGAIVDNLASHNPGAPEFSGQNPSTLPIPPKRNPVFFNDRGLRSGWRLAIYTSPFIALWLISRGRNTSAPAALPPLVTLVGEIVSFAVVFGLALIMSRIERRPPGQYGLPISEAFGRKFWLGMLIGLLEISILMGLISVFGGYSFGNLALSGSDTLRWGLFHLLLFTFVGLFEEFAFRGYTQFTLAEGIGFWPAALVLSLGFGAVHLGNRGEGPVGAASVALVGIFFAFTLYRTGNLWYAVGLHASFDWGETYLFSVPNSGTVMEGHLSNSILHGAKWLTGGTVGPEGSVFCFLTMGLQFLVVMWLFPKKEKAAHVAAAF